MQFNKFNEIALTRYHWKFINECFFAGAELSEPNKHIQACYPKGNGDNVKIYLWFACSEALKSSILCLACWTWLY